MRGIILGGYKLYLVVNSGYKNNIKRRIILGDM